MEDVDIALLKKKSLTGIVALTSRTLVLQIIAFGATFLLTIFLTPAIFGIFFVVSAIISFLGYFSDIGLAAALIQKKEPLTEEDLTTTFTIQQVLVGAVVIVSLLFSGQIGSFYRLDADGVWLLRALIFSFFLSSLKTIPSVLLERNLEFSKLVIPQLLETIGFYSVAVVLAWRGFGVQTFTWAVLVRAVVGLVSMFAISPWKVGFGFARPVAKKLLRFGLPFQANSFLALVKDDLMTVFLGKILPFNEIGYIGWAKKWAEVPLRLIMDSVVRVTFPAFSRIQHNRTVLRNAIEKTLFGLSASIFPITVGLLFYIAPLIHIIPKYGKWEPALVSFYLFAVTASIASLSTPLTNALNAVGKIKITLWLMVMWTVLTWVLTVAFIQFIGFNGFSLALLVISGTIIVVVGLVKRMTAFSFLGSVSGPITASLCQALFYIVVSYFYRTTIPFGLVLSGLGGVILYGGVLWTIEKNKIRVLAEQLRPLLWKR